MNNKARNWDTNEYVAPITDWNASSVLPPLNVPLLIMDRAHSLIGGFHDAHMRATCLEHGPGSKNRYLIHSFNKEFHIAPKWVLLLPELTARVMAEEEGFRVARLEASGLLHQLGRLGDLTPEQQYEIAAGKPARQED